MKAKSRAFRLFEATSVLFTSHCGNSTVILSYVLHSGNIHIYLPSSLCSLFCRAHARVFFSPPPSTISAHYILPVKCNLRTCSHPYAGTNTRISTFCCATQPLILLVHNKSYVAATSKTCLDAKYGHTNTNRETRHSSGMNATALLSIHYLYMTTEVIMHAYQDSCFRRGTYWLEGYDAGRFNGITVQTQYLKITDSDGLETSNL